ncbi:type IX secretion system anionic LPS delivery protein PorZ [Chitinophaga niabensis]|uniref:Por secretion system C-terminal sorting domain-containing protein n=1 Tax=Chitinophaga niabensis TaxID=536979 RepID=A0A1N6JGH7_9BACT|nr:hypothetical protein [Chitinophaga niabensis]SIO43271.1 Por secretion system C-terminal sorting domain-containing protein [Chitinophaga niabensis]
MRIGSFFLSLLLFSSLGKAQSVPIGQWREHFPYRQAVSIAAGEDHVYCASPFSLFSVSLQDNEITRYSKVNGLHDAGIAGIGYHESSQALVIAYNNSNLDILRKENIINIPDILLRQTSGDKRIYHIACWGNHAYLSTGIGIIALNLERYEITDTYLNLKVTAVATDDRYFYAATANGIKRGLLQGSNLADPQNWMDLPQPGIVTTLANIGQRVIAQVKDTLFIWNQTQWDRWYADGQAIRGLTSSGNSLFVSQPGRVLQLSAAGAITATFQSTTPSGAVNAGNSIWIADNGKGLLQYNNGVYQNLTPNAPPDIIRGEMIIHQNALWAAAGAVTTNWQGTGNKSGVFKFEGDEWQSYQATDSLADIVTVAGTADVVYAGSFGRGLWTVGSTALQDPPVQVSGLATDKDGNLWVSDYGAQNNLLVKKKDNSWLQFSIPVFHIARAVSQILVDDADQKWIVSPRGNGVFVFNHGSSLDNTLDDRWKLYQTGAGRGNLPSDEVKCIAKDLQGWIWIGTTRGVGVVQCATQALSPGGCEAVLPIVRQDNFAGFLFQNEQVNTIAVDGANRKWVGTQNGVWLISPNGEKLIQHFNTGNSPLSSNIIYRIIVHPVTGEVFFATATGLISWRGTATEGSTTQGKDVLVFPNPVPRGYEGTIAIRGLVLNAIVKITDITGKLVFQTRAHGGQAVWNGVDYTGHRPQSGVYLVFASNEDGQEKLVTKLVFIH